MLVWLENTSWNSSKNKSEYGSEEATRQFVLGCSGNMNTCSVHGEGRKRRPRWTFVDSLEKVDKETKLANGQFQALFMVGQPDPAEMQSGVEWPIELRELLLDLEEKMEQGLLGRLPSHIDRQTWRDVLLDTGDITSLMDRDVVVKGAQDDVIVTACNPRGVREIDLAEEITFFRPRIVEVMEKVETKLANGQFQALFMVGQPDPAEMQSGVEWPIELRELLLDLEEKARCRACRRKANAEALVLCADCNRCYHFQCARLGVGPAPLDWCCADCKAIRRKIAAAERRKAQKEAALQKPEEASDEEHVGDENSLSTTLDTDEYTESPARSFAPILRDADLSARARIEALENIIREAMRETYAWPFLEPVDKKEVPDYYDVISRPMDLRTMINKIKQHVYDTPEEVRSDAYLIIANCKEYNEEGSEIFDVSD
ncbi:Bromodomain protein [Teladorsagia circumcincta]|uniref:Bromodomain protein n=1 Tax=Teladorsagia circumcincta TaxID=45464 RepID=A0A2G9U267_TELCI|nr:Bromodomain protein [Teladorsagia circumcincta]